MRGEVVPFAARICISSVLDGPPIAGESGGDLGDLEASVRALSVPIWGEAVLESLRSRGGMFLAFGISTKSVVQGGKGTALT